ncbi:hypothetical protein EKG35_07020 [Lysinibacillus telephonicus]|uniref:Uncharacterized protein n=1 Tax=Lysinibacillus telephonicus TaxID=1714840 RepID=A0A431UUC2_9BACI|nr:hypothetical protein EKG35_07020 [Lysinibacillus telephonicus]
MTGGNATEGGKGPSGGNAITNSTGEAVTGGKATEGGEGPSGGKAAEGGEGPSGGKAAEGGESPSGGNVPTGDSLTGGDSTKGGEGPNGGQNPTGGEGPNEGQNPTGGEGPNGGQNPSGGEGSNGGQNPTGGDGPNGGQNPSGGEGSNGGQNPTGGDGPNGGQNPSGGEGSTGGENPTGDTSNGEAGDSGGNTKTPSLLNIFLNSTTEENGIWGTISQTLKDAKTYATSFVKPVLEGAAATYAGFKFEKLESGNYKVRGKSSLKNPVLNHFYNNYKKYKIDGKERYMPAGKSNQKPFKVSSFFDSKKLAQTKKDILGTTWKNLKSGLNDGYNVFSKKFWAKSNLSKLNGPLSIAATLFGNVDKHGANAFKSSKFYADVTVDLAIGAGTTVASSVISSAVTGAMAGSVVPGVGTIVGAGVGLAVGLGSAWFMNGTSTGRKAKEWISNKVSEGYSFAADLVSKGASKLADKAQGLFNGAKKLFGFG